MTTQHTPGPWQQDDHPLDLSQVAHCLLAEKGTPNEWVGVGPYFGPDDPDGEGQEHVAYCHPVNAPLMAAAPDLLTLAEAVLSIGNLKRGGICHGIDPTEYAATVAPLAHAAIAKATAR